MMAATTGGLRPISAEEVERILGSDPPDPLCQVIIDVFLTHADRTSFRCIYDEFAADVEGENGKLSMNLLPSYQGDYHLNFFAKPASEIRFADLSFVAGFGHSHILVRPGVYTGQPQIRVFNYTEETDEIRERLDTIVKEISKVAPTDIRV